MVCNVTATITYNSITATIEENAIVATFPWWQGAPWIPWNPTELIEDSSTSLTKTRSSQKIEGILNKSTILLDADYTLSSNTVWVIIANITDWSVTITIDDTFLVNKNSIYIKKVVDTVDDITTTNTLTVVANDWDVRFNVDWYPVTSFELTPVWFSLLMQYNESNKTFYAI